MQGETVSSTTFTFCLSHGMQVGQTQVFVKAVYTCIHNIPTEVEFSCQLVAWCLSPEFSWSLLQTDSEEAKGHEISKLQNSLQEMQAKIDEKDALLVKEREAAQKAIEEAAAAVKETQVPVEDTAKIEELSAEVETLKVLLSTIVLSLHPFPFVQMCVHSLCRRYKWLGSLYEVATIFQVFHYCSTCW